jgi:uncharacterized Zn finger protein
MECNCPDWGMPCKHLAAVCYVLAEAFDDDPFAMLAWRGKERDELLAELRGARGGAPDGGTAAPPPAPAGPGDSPALAVLAGVPGPSAEQAAASFWSPGLSQARLNALPQSPSAPPDLLLRLADPPDIEVRGQPLRDLLAPVYRQLADDSEPPPADS